jgi:hypothetical protein
MHAADAASLAATSTGLLLPMNLPSDVDDSRCPVVVVCRW